MEKRAFKNNVYQEIATIVKGFAHSNRLEIIDLLANGPKSVEQIAKSTAISIANASQHLQRMKKERLVKTTQRGNQNFYALTNNEVFFAWKAMRDLAFKLNAHIPVMVNDFRQQYEVSESVTLEDLTEEKNHLLLDVRPKEEFDFAHLENAISIPISDLKNRLNELPKNKLIITHCRGSFCTYADEAVLMLKQNGFDARRLEEGVMERLEN